MDDITSDVFRDKLEALKPKFFSEISDIYFNKHNVKCALSKLCNSSASGPDGVPPLVLKNGGKFVIDALCDLGTMSMENSDIPEIIKTMWISPTWKGGARCDPAEYRPLALTSHILKILERVIRVQLVQYLEDNHLMDASQHGSRAGRSTLTQLIKQHEIIIE